MADHSEETGLDSGTESQKETETGIKTGIEKGTEVLEVEDVHLEMEAGEEVLIEQMGGRGLEAGRKTEVITGEEGGKETGTEIGIETEIGTETGIETGRKTETGTGRGRESVTETGKETGTEIGTTNAIATDGTGERGEVAWIVRGNVEGVMMRKSMEGGRVEKEEGVKEEVEKEGEDLKEKKGTGQGENVERGPPGGIGMIDWPNWKTWTDFGPLTTQDNPA